MIYCVEMLSLVCDWFATVVRGMFDLRRNIISTVAIKSNISGRDSATQRCYCGSNDSFVVPHSSDKNVNSWKSHFRCSVHYSKRFFNKPNKPVIS